MQIDRWLHLSSSLLGIPLCCNFIRKRIDQKNFPFVATNNWIVLAAQWLANYFFAPNFSLFWKSGGEKKERREAITKLFTFQANALILKGMLGPISCIDINTHIGRKWKIIFIDLFIDNITSVISSTQIACDVMCVQHIIH